MTKKIVLTVLLAFALVSCSGNISSLQVTYKNPISISRTDARVSITVNELKNIKNDFTEDSFVIMSGDTELPYQIITGDNGEKEVLFVADFGADEEKTFTFKYGSSIEKKDYESRTYAELAMKPDSTRVNGKFTGDYFVNVTDLTVPEIHTDHDALFKYEGPGWESEKVGYRYYLDWRNAIDIFGKKENKLLLHEIGAHDTVAADDSYHEMQEWGMDIFNVGNTLGIGSIGMLVNGQITRVEKTDSVNVKITENGPIQSQIKSAYYGWQVNGNKYDLTSTMSISAGSRLTKTEIDVNGNPPNISTGFAQYEGTDFLQKLSEGEWSYIALYGKQTLADDSLGIVVFFKNSQLGEIVEDDINHVAMLTPQNGKITYYFGAAWEQEPNGIKNEKQFVDYINDALAKLDNPITRI